MLLFNCVISCINILSVVYSVKHFSYSSETDMIMYVFKVTYKPNGLGHTVCVPNCHTYKLACHYNK